MFTDYNDYVGLAKELERKNKTQILSLIKKKVKSMSGVGKSCFFLSFLCCLCCSLGKVSLQMLDLCEYWMNALSNYKKQDEEKATRVFKAAMKVFQDVSQRATLKLQLLQEEEKKQMSNMTTMEYLKISLSITSIRLEWGSPTAAMHTMLTNLKHISNNDNEFVTPDENKIVLAALPMFYPVLNESRIKFRLDRMVAHKSYQAFQELKI